MKVQVLDIVYDVPASRSELTLQKRYEYDIAHGDDLNQRITETIENEDITEQERNDLLADLYIERVRKTFSFFTGTDLQEVDAMEIGPLVQFYELHLKDLLNTDYDDEDTTAIINGDELYWLPEPTLTPQSTITLNELVTAKEVSRNLSTTSSQKLHAIALLATIFLRKTGEQFSESLLSQDERMQMMWEIPMDVSLKVANFFEQWSEFVRTNFSCFEKPKVKGGVNMEKHFDKWGWVSFLNYVATEGTIFYKSNNKSNLDNIKEAKAYDVLMWASCEKDKEDIIAAHNDEMARKQKRN